MMVELEAPPDVWMFSDDLATAADVRDPCPGRTTQDSSYQPSEAMVFEKVPYAEPEAPGT